MKKCFKCGEAKPLADFYKHKMMADGHLNKCKDCAKSDAKKTRTDNIDHYREYDRTRGNRQHEGYNAEYRTKYPKKYKAHTMVNNAVRDGRMKKLCCEICGSANSVAHHDDYDFPLTVRWMCQAHHCQWHAEHGEAANAE